MRLIPLRLWCLAALSGVLQVLIFPVAATMPGWPVVGWVALVPLLHALAGQDKSGNLLTARQGALLGYACGFVWYLGNCYWIYQTMYLYGGLPKPVALGILILFSLYLGLYHALFGALFVALRRLGTGWALALAPFCWVAVELARARVTGFPWDLLGNSQVSNLFLTKLAPVGGVMALSFVLMAVNCLLACFVIARTKHTYRLAAVGCVAALLLQYGPGTSARYFAAATTETAVMLQENLEVGAVGKEVAPIGTEEMYRQFAGLSVNAMNSSTAQTPSRKPGLIVWPEAPTGFLSSDARFREVVGGLAKSTGAAVIAGSLGVDRDATAVRGYKSYDSATLFTPDGSYAGRYDKIHLVPWGEYVPFKQFFFFAAKLTEGVGNMDPGSKRDVFHSGGHTYGVFICYESIFGDEVREFVNNGAEVLVNISDDGWYGDTGAPWQHLNMARMRAIENRRWIIRDTNTGVTTTIDPLGRTLLDAPRHVRGAYSMPFGYESGLTFYTRFGDWFAWVCAVVALGGVLVGRWKKAEADSPLREG